MLIAGNYEKYIPEKRYLEVNFTPTISDRYIFFDRIFYLYHCIPPKHIFYNSLLSDNLVEVEIM